MSERDKEAGREPVTTQREHDDVHGVAAETQDPGKAGDAHGGAMPRPRAVNAGQAAEVAGPEEITKVKRDVAPGGTIETALTRSGEPSMVASQLLWDGSSATSRIDESIAEAIGEAEHDDGERG
ncbi:hypothetical protein GCM10010116_35510 [Microbispora rosea subsp. aerata]|nr:hypothetical protein [Microbispora rosea]GGO17562.1 hypothetical protein GCM10010116_35510 [Microbispora rosea subsp. aerata]GIH56565.1 hypothetical protein Mro02_34790 [Microbispora rosea subsp. aerata]GLJ81906.1 hypothetical protein GCM10017588_06310 [Microbispora rosea subsp. aerata]